jgi:hypothetical protein
LPRLRSLCVLVLLFSASTRITHAGEKPWTEVRSPNFRVLTNGTAGEGRRVAREFEQMRAVFAIAFPKMRLETGAALTIFALRDPYSMKAMAPAFWKPSGIKPAGLFQKRWERQYAVVRLDQEVPGKYNIVYHEHLHSLLQNNTTALQRFSSLSHEIGPKDISFGRISLRTANSASPLVCYSYKCRGGSQSKTKANTCRSPADHLDIR